MTEADRRPWRRPVPLVGDASAASERAADPSGWALPAEVKEALHEVIAARQDVRRYRPDPVPDDALERVLTAAHRAPSVGHSQPWRFVVVHDAAIRDRAAALADRERLRQAAQLDPDAARRLLDLQLEGIREAPLGIVVCCDRRAPAAGVLGRATFPDTDVWSCACAIQNLWLAARAERLGLGLGYAVPSGGSGRAGRTSRGRRHPRLVVPGLAGREATRAGPGAGRMVAAAAPRRRDPPRPLAG